MKEVWKDIEGYEGLYQVSNLGRVKSLSRFINNGNGLRKTKEKILKPNNISGYSYVILHKKNGEFHNIAIHILVAKSFVDGYEYGKQVGHKDESRNNNNANNLEWVTPKENSNTPKHKERIANSRKNIAITEQTRKKMGESHKGGKSSTAKKVICDGIVFECAGYCAEFYNIKSRIFRRYLDGSRKMPQKFKELGLRYYKENEE